MLEARHVKCVPIGAAVVSLVLAAGMSNAQTSSSANAVPKTSNPPAASKPGETANVLPLPPGYVIGADDVLSIVYWRERDMSTDVQVRPDGMISLPLLNEVLAAGLTPSQLRDRLNEESQKYMEDPNVAVVVKQINSRKVYVTGQVGKVGAYPLSLSMTVMQFLSTVGGIGEFAKSKNIMILRTENGRQVAHKFNYKEVISGKKLTQNIELKPGDTIVVP